MQNNEVTTYLNDSIRHMLEKVALAALSNPQEAAYLLRCRKYTRQAQQQRCTLEAQNVHVPAFLMASVTGACNLRCKGCFAWTCGTCQQQPKQELSAAEWNSVFTQAAQLGISFVLLLGGEPLLRQDVLEVAATHPELVFPIFTNGTKAGEYRKLFDAHRNLVPVFSMEGLRQRTDDRRGAGVYDHVLEQMTILQNDGVLFGCSVTVTTENLNEVTSELFLQTLVDVGCRLVFYVEYEPTDSHARNLAFTEETRPQLEQTVARLRNDWQNLVFFSFPGDEKHMGGCLAAGRGFFHLSPHGEAQACPFSPYGDCSVRDMPLQEVLQSPLFHALREEKLVGGPHTGGCTLYAQELKVRCLAGKAQVTE